MAMSAKLLEVDDLEVGMLVTVVPGGLQMDGMQGFAATSMEEVSAKVAEAVRGSKYDGLGGMPMQIKLLEFPFVVAVHYKCRRCPMFQIDVRIAKFKAISREYAEALKDRRPWWKFWGSAH